MLMMLWIISKMKYRSSVDKLLKIQKSIKERIRAQVKGAGNQKRNETKENHKKGGEKVDKEKEGEGKMEEE